MDAKMLICLCHFEQMCLVTKIKLKMRELVTLTNLGFVGPYIFKHSNK
jgi:hypothetical protein